MSLQYGDIVVSASIAPMHIGSAVAYLLHGAFCCQAIWYYRNFKTDRFYIKLLILLIVLIQSLNFGFIVYQMHYYLIHRGIGMDWTAFVSCFHWTFIANYITTEACCFLVEGFYLYRLFTFLHTKKLIFIPLVTFATGWVFTMIMIIQTSCFPCVPETIPKTKISLTASFAFRILTDVMITTSMTYMLRERRAMAARRTNSIALLRSLIIWSISTGAIMWISSITYLATYVTMPENTICLAIYFVRSGIYTNAMLAMFNHRERFRTESNDSFPMDSLSAFKSTQQDKSGSDLPDPFNELNKGPHASTSNSCQVFEQAEFTSPRGFTDLEV